MNDTGNLANNNGLQPVLDEIRLVLESARASAARNVNTVILQAY